MDFRNILRKTKYIIRKILSFPIVRGNLYLIKKFSNIFFTIDTAKWALDHTANMTFNMTKNSNYFLNSEYKFKISIIRPKNQFLFLSDQYSLFSKNIFNEHNIIAIDYQHGLPEYAEINKSLLEIVKKNQDKIKLIRVTNSFFKNFLIDNNIAENKIIQIPLTIDENFKQMDKNKRLKIKDKMKLPLNKYIIGSFQKDGNGWDKGSSPKYIKGPDIFLKSLELIKKNIPNLFVLLTGPARGYVKNGLKKLDIEYKHLDFLKFNEIPKIYNCLDLYLICSRDEGGPYALLESMKSGVPVISTKVGMTHDLIKHGKNGFSVDVEDFEKIAEYTTILYNDKEMRKDIIQNALDDVSNYSQNNHIPLWENFFKKLTRF